jgi:Na+/melibiose symporter-like transporter
VATALAMAVTGYLLGKIGYSEASQMTPEISNGIKYLFALGSSIPLALSAVVVVFTPMSRSRHSSLLEAIALKKEGKPYSIDGFRALFNDEKEASKYSA